jgi:hypothetical protein
MANSTCKGTDCKALILGKDKAPVAFPLRHITNNRTNLPTTSQILGVKHQKKYYFTVSSADHSNTAPQFQ